MLDGNNDNLKEADIRLKPETEQAVDEYLVLGHDAEQGDIIPQPEEEGAGPFEHIEDNFVPVNEDFNPDQFGLDLVPHHHGALEEPAQANPEYGRYQLRFPEEPRQRSTEKVYYKTPVPCLSSR